MNIANLPALVLKEILKYLNLKQLVNLSRVSKIFNYLCKNKNHDIFNKFLGMDYDIRTFEIFPEKRLISVNPSNYLVISNGWKNILFYLLLDYIVCFV